MSWGLGIGRRPAHGQPFAVTHPCSALLTEYDPQILQAVSPLLRQPLEATQHQRRQAPIVRVRCSMSQELQYKFCGGRRGPAPQCLERLRLADSRTGVLVCTTERPATARREKSPHC